jgi:hypothetical protein
MGQVGKQLADAGIAWISTLPLRHGHALWALRSRDPLGLRQLTMVSYIGEG